MPVPIEPFTLEVEFSGLCMYLVHPHKPEIGVALPDGRRHDRNKPLTHADREMAVPHAGYLRFDLADAMAGVPGGPRDDPGLDITHPQYEVVHLFDFEELDFGLGEAPLDIKALEIADISGFTTDKVAPHKKLFSKTPPKALLARTVLRGGEINSAAPDDHWVFDDLLKPQSRYGGRFVGTMTWTRKVNAEELILRFKTWNGADKTVIRLKPTSADRVVRLKIANLCAENALEWDELGFRRTSAQQPHDLDFKWFYRLLDHEDETFAALTLNAKRELPHPVLDEKIPNNVGGGPNCDSAMMTFAFDAAD